MNYTNDMCATTCEPPRVAEPSIAELLKKCGDVISECLAMTDVMLHLIGDEPDPACQRQSAPNCMRSAAMMNCDDAIRLSEMLKRLSNMLGG